MAFQSFWYQTKLPIEVVDIMEKDLTKIFQNDFTESKLHGNVLNDKKRNSKNAWVPSTHWSAGFVWHYVERANRENFLYDLTCIDGESMQFTQYSEGEFYSWHNDAGFDNMYTPKAIANVNAEDRIQDLLNTSIEKIRKLSFVVQLSDHDSYEGGNLQLLSEMADLTLPPEKKEQ